jgi:cytochrome c biogenesis protein CcmG/thiol:disulfide interchange protein DsbE
MRFRAALARSVLAVVAGALAVTGCSGASGSVARVGGAAPKLAARTIDGGHVDLASYRGKPLLVLFGADYCEPCRKEWPQVAATARTHPDLAIVGVSYEDSRSLMLGFTREIGVTFPVADDPDGTVAEHWGVHGIPQAFFVDRRGRITARVIGERPDDLRKALAALLAA